MSEKITKQFYGICKSIDIENRTVTHYITTKDIDRTGDIVIPTGALINSYLAGGGVVLWAHEQDDAPIGKCVNLVMLEDGWEATTYFYEHEEAEKLWNIVKLGGLKTWSIGFIPVEVHYDGEIRVIDRWELLEYSLVNVPANPKALSKAYMLTSNIAFIDELKNINTDEAKEELTNLRMESAKQNISLKINEIKSYKQHLDKNNKELPQNLREFCQSLVDILNNILMEDDPMESPDEEPMMDPEEEMPMDDDGCGRRRKPEEKELIEENGDQPNNDITENGDQPNNETPDEKSFNTEEIAKKLAELKEMFANKTGNAVLTNFSGRTI